ncbi:hypothetical protein DICPUDRAFT_97663 [Dictyostelium purpureum]|uniref:Catalase n=1 Tax=Dictyostelium purpureum TaxID=5786 RepID=F0ZIQ0_DICPU|nr:uncharacterized protein DICPUDRAFT_97663 [Dictyostelium purpureum]EGC36159.1 hypothetical protein DICPUDRAFT_97663 [Dictyostelium purpureum]|eukprot:XP_003287292.1 hypothetical protein DICPUDRAFT_97663 [Dictyostelium purpureum]
MDKKIEQLKCFESSPKGENSTTNFGVKISNDENTLKAGPRGPSLLEDFVFREKMTHFDHERIPERIVHARGSGAHGYFVSYADHSNLTKASFLSAKDKKTPLFARVSTVQGPRGSADTVRDVRGFAVKFYTDEGNFDIVGNNIPVFFVQDAISFPDFVHAGKMEQQNEMPTGGSAHDTFYDYISLKPETAHTVMWVMSDRGIPLSIRHLQAFGVHTYRLINAQGKSTFIKWFWKPLSGTLSLLWDEAQKIAGKNGDYHRKRLWDDIEAGDFPQWELCVQILSDEIIEKFEFDILDPTKFIPEELAPVTPVGRMVLNKNPDNFFAETEQIAFCVSHVVPGIDFSNDPLLQGRIFSYLDTQLSRLGGPNFNEIPINRPVCPFANTQRDGIHRMTINKGGANYFPNSIDGNYPRPKEEASVKGGFLPYPEKIDAVKTYKRSETFNDHFSQATMFWNSMSQHEKNHIVDGFSFELSKVTRRNIVERVVNEFLINIDKTLAEKVGKNLGVTVEPKVTKNIQKKLVKPSPAISQVNLLSGDIASRRIAVLIFDGCDTEDVMSFKKEMEKRDAHVDLLAPSNAPVRGCDGPSLTPKSSWVSEPSIFYDAVYVPSCGQESLELLQHNGDFLHYILESYKHLKTIAFSGCPSIIKETLRLKQDLGLILGQGWRDVVEAFTYSLAHHRVWERESLASTIPA